MKKLNLLVLLFLVVMLVSCNAATNSEYDLKSYYGDLFHMGLLPVMNDSDEWGYVNTSGEEQIEPQYYNVNLFTDNGFAIVQNSEYSYNFINTDGEEQLNTDFQYIDDFVGSSTVYKTDDGDWGILLDTIEIKAEGEYQIIRNSDYNNRHIALYQHYFHLINEQGELLTTDGYDEIQPFEDGASITVVGEDRRFGVINSEGEEILPVIYDDIEINAVNNTISVELDEFYGLMDKDGETILDIQYTNQHIRFCGPDDLTAIFIKQNRYLGVINLDGEIIIEPTLSSHSDYDGLEGFRDGYHMFRDENERMSYLYDQKGKRLEEVLFDEITNYDDELFSTWDGIGSTVVRNYNNGTIVTVEGEIVFSQDDSDIFFAKERGSSAADMYNYKGDLLYENISVKSTSFFNGLLVFSTEGENWGVMDQKGTIVIEESFKMYSCPSIFFDDGYLVMYDGQNYNVINRTGKIILENTYKEIKYFNPWM